MQLEQRNGSVLNPTNAKCEVAPRVITVSVPTFAYRAHFRSYSLVFCCVVMEDISFVPYCTDRRSVSGGVVMCAGGPVSWHSKTQKCVTLSTTQAEYVAMSDMGKEILFLRQVWCFMLPKARMPCIAMYEDNEGAIQIAKHPISNSNSKHIDVRHHFLRELVERKEIEIIHIASQYQHADFLTKALPEREFEFHRGIVMNLM